MKTVLIKNKEVELEDKDAALIETIQELTYELKRSNNK